MVNNTFLNNIQYALERLDKNSWTKVKYNEVDFTIDLIQPGNMVTLGALKGLIQPDHYEALLAPASLQELIHDIDVMIHYPDVMLMAPKDLGFKVYVRDLKVYDGPRLFTELNFYTIKNRLYLWYLKLTNKRIKRIMNM